VEIQCAFAGAFGLSAFDQLGTGGRCKRPPVFMSGTSFVVVSITVARGKPLLHSV